MKNNRDKTDQNDSKSKPHILVDILLGAGISIVFYLIIWWAFANGLGLLLHLLVSLVLVGALMLAVYFFKSERKGAAVTIVVMLFAPILVLVVVGALGLLFLPA